MAAADVRRRHHRDARRPTRARVCGPAPGHTGCSPTRPPTTTTTIRPTTTTTSTTVPVGDADGDGVADSLDRCPATPVSDLADATGCSVCPCDGPGGVAWPSRSAYLRCVRAEARRRLDLGGIDARADRDARVAALRSSCGRANRTRCCVYAGAEDATGRCRIVRSTSCQLAGGVDLGSGSCMPSPCAR